VRIPLFQATASSTAPSAGVSIHPGSSMAPRTSGTSAVTTIASGPDTSPTIRLALAPADLEEVLVEPQLGMQASVVWAVAAAFAVGLSAVAAALADSAVAEASAVGEVASTEEAADIGSLSDTGQAVSKITFLRYLSRVNARRRLRT
jgi:hypothetical protein